MKIFIITVAVVIVYSFTMVFAQDYRQAQRNSYRLKYVCEELSATGAAFYDLEDYSEGYTIFNTEEGISAIKEQITNLLSVDGGLTPVDNSYWLEPIKYKVYFYDDSEVCKVYSDGSFERKEAFTYGNTHEDDWTVYNKVISDPTVVVSINAGPARFRVKFLDAIPDIIRSSSHEWEGR
ncbi:MAG: hypothetical protein H8E13_20180 [Actinobacteria bacterium]|nr:hypothetical protein [Actinomycetota bacterium]